MLRFFDGSGAFALLLRSGCCSLSSLFSSLQSKPCKNRPVIIVFCDFCTMPPNPTQGQNPPAHTPPPQGRKDHRPLLIPLTHAAFFVVGVGSGEMARVLFPPQRRRHVCFVTTLISLFFFANHTPSSLIGVGPPTCVLSLSLLCLLLLLRSPLPPSDTTRNAHAPSVRIHIERKNGAGERTGSGLWLAEESRERSNAFLSLQHLPYRTKCKRLCDGRTCDDLV